MASAAQLQKLAWCFSDKNLSEQTAQVESAVEADANLRFSSDKDFAHWLFRQPRGGVTPSFALVVGWREAKLCMASVRAARTGETDGMRPDKTRPRLVEALPRGSPFVNVAVGAMVVVATKAEQREKALEWARSGECDGLVAVRVACGPCEVEACLRSFLGRQRQPMQPTMPTLPQQQRQHQHYRQQQAACPAPQCSSAQPVISRQGSSRLGQWASAQPDISRARSSRLRSPSPNYTWPGFARSADASPSCLRLASPWRVLGPSHHEEVADSCRMSNASTASDGYLSSGPASPRGRPASPGSDSSLEDSSTAGTRSPSPDYMWHGFSRRGAEGADKAGAERPLFSGSAAGFQCLASPSGSHRGF